MQYVDNLWAQKCSFRVIYNSEILGKIPVINHRAIVKQILVYLFNETAYN